MEDSRRSCRFCWRARPPTGEGSWRAARQPRGEVLFRGRRSAAFFREFRQARERTNAYDCPMPFSARSSRQRFEEYRQRLGEQSDVQPTADKFSAPPARLRGEQKPRLRSTGQLLRAFWNLLRGQRGAVSWSVLTLTVSTALGLVPPASTKFLVDYVLGQKALPPFWARWLPADRWWLLVSVAVGVTGISAVKVGLHLWGRWYATRATKRIQMSVRKRLFDHAVRLPLPRVQLKSGGIASMSGGRRRDWRIDFRHALQSLAGDHSAPGQFGGLGLVDWRLLLGSLILLPAVYLTHRTWIRRNSSAAFGTSAPPPGNRRVMPQRHSPAFASSCAFNRQRTEAYRIISNQHLMGRQELLRRGGECGSSKPFGVCSFPWQRPAVALRRLASV